VREAAGPVGGGPVAADRQAGVLAAGGKRAR
jgi:hypothetical protein